jgi:hypothetical protein
MSALFVHGVVTRRDRQRQRAAALKQRFGYAVAVLSIACCTYAGVRLW